MTFTQPSELEIAIRKIAGRSPVGSILGSAEWQDVPVALRDRAFFSATIENARFLNTAQSFLNDFLRNTRETLPSGETALKADGRARFIAGMQQLAIEEGIGPIGKIQDKSVRDIRSNARLGLIFDTQVRSAYHYGNWRSGLTGPILDAFPAQKFVRYPGAKVKRPLHERNEGQIRLKSDIPFWLEMNAKDIGGFAVSAGHGGGNVWVEGEQVGRRKKVGAAIERKQRAKLDFHFKGKQALDLLTIKQSEQGNIQFTHIYPRAKQFFDTARKGADFLESVVPKQFIKSVQMDIAKDDSGNA